MRTTQEYTRYKEHQREIEHFQSIKQLDQDIKHIITSSKREK